jgi:hypothetical protein
MQLATILQVLLLFLISVVSFGLGMHASNKLSSAKGTNVLAKDIYKGYEDPDVVAWSPYERQYYNHVTNTWSPVMRN